MARRRRSFLNKLFWVCVLMLAVVGAATLYGRYKGDVVNHGEKVMKKAEKVKKVLVEK